MTCPGGKVMCNNNNNNTSRETDRIADINGRP